MIQKSQLLALQAFYPHFFELLDVLEVLSLSHLVLDNEVWLYSDTVIHCSRILILLLILSKLLHRWNEYIAYSDIAIILEKNFSHVHFRTNSNSI
jgi:hypothetical protein